MNTLTIAILVVCATMAYASAIPGPAASPVAGEPAEIFQTAENRYHGGGGRHGNYGRGGYGGGHGGRGGYGGRGGGWGK